MILASALFASLIFAVQQEPCYDTQSCNSSRWVLELDGEEMAYAGDMTLEECEEVKDQLVWDLKGTDFDPPPVIECVEQYTSRQEM